MTREETLKEIRKCLETWDHRELVNELMLHIEEFVEASNHWSDLVEFYRKDDIQKPG